MNYCTKIPKLKFDTDATGFGGEGNTYNGNPQNTWGTISVKKRLFLFLFIFILFSLLGCQHTPMQIPSGEYCSTAGKEYIVVKPSTIFFHLKVIGKPDVFIDREYKYNLWKNGEIFPDGIASGEYYLGIGKYDLHWDGKDIIVKEINTGSIIVFKKRLRCGEIQMRKNGQSGKHIDSEY